MKITRVGARADNGPSSISLSNLTVVFENNSKEISLTDRDVGDFVTKAHYNYDMRLSLAEIGKIVEALSSHSTENASEVAAALSPYLKHLIRITNTCVNNG
jgi:pantoate kinase